MDTGTVSEIDISAPQDISSTTSVPFADLGLISQQEYETQLFGFTPKSFSDGLYNATVEYLHDGLTSVAQVLKTELKNGEQCAHQLDEAAEKVFEQLQPSIGKLFDKVEVFVGQNIFKIKPNLLLEEDKLWLDYPSANAASVQQLEADIRSLEDKIIALKHCNGNLREELGEAEALAAQLRPHIERQKSQLAACRLLADQAALLKSL